MTPKRANSEVNDDGGEISNPKTKMRKFELNPEAKPWTGSYVPGRGGEVEDEVLWQLDEDVIVVLPGEGGARGDVKGDDDHDGDQIMADERGEMREGKRKKHRRTRPKKKGKKDIPDVLYGEERQEASEGKEDIKGKKPVEDEGTEGDDEDSGAENGAVGVGEDGRMDARRVRADRSSRLDRRKRKKGNKDKKNKKAAVGDAVGIES